MSNLAIIPARGGSKRIPKKNIKDFLGKPIIAYSIEVAIKSRLFDEVMVSTDDNEIVSIANYYGAITPFLRSADTSNDTAILSEVIDEVKESYSRLGKKFDNICCILPTAALTTVVLLDKGLKLLNNNDVDSVRPIIRFSYPIQRSLRLESNGNVSFFYPEFQGSRSQDLEPAFHDSGMFYWMKYNSGLKGSKKLGFEIPELSCQDIDTEEDWKLAELKYKLAFQL